ncbi:MAG: hypothetical protein LBP55_00575 [Candidatus Adiutrix sp.]|jgi:cell wall-associated NlpC family hydrolase|nr:hypothetical protein [Candidatus Adiutrix sp.]
MSRRLTRLALAAGLSLALPALAAEAADPPPLFAPALTEALAPLLATPFRIDGATDEAGRWVTFNRPDQVSPRPGFNCSGFTVAAARSLLGRNFNLAEVSRDRRGDSGPGATLGQDWDFGLDLISNLAEGYPHRWLPEPADPAAPPLIPLGPGRALGWGVDLHSPEFERELSRLQPGRLAFFVFSKPTGLFPAGVSYYHVGIIIPDPPARWLYHTTLGGGAHRVNLAEPAALARLRRHFPPVKAGERRVLLLEVTPPE